MQRPPQSPPTFDQTTLINTSSDGGGMAAEADQRIDIIVDLQAPNARGNLNKLLHRLYSESPYLKIYVNKWHEWEDFSHKDNPTAPRAVFYPGVFQVFLERKLVKAYNVHRERRKAEEKNLSARNTKMGSTHTTFVESETRESVET